nr:hypothetical protein [Rhodoferax sp.]
DEHGRVAAATLSNRTDAAIDLSPATAEPVVASIYQLDAIVRRSTSLQLTADARVAGSGTPLAAPQEALA